MANLRPYPTTWTDAASVIINELPGLVSGAADLPLLAHAVEDMLGFALGKFYPDGKIVLEGPHVGSLFFPSDKEFVAKLQEAIDAGADDPGIDWKTLLANLVQLLLRIFVRNPIMSSVLRHALTAHVPNPKGNPPGYGCDETVDRLVREQRCQLIEALYRHEVIAHEVGCCCDS